MKRILIITLLAVSMLSQAQPAVLNAFFDQYSGKEGYTSVYITKYMFELFARIADEEDEAEFKQLTSNLNSIKILIINSDQSSSEKSQFHKELKKILSSPGFNELMIVKDGPETITFMVHDTGDKIDQLVMTVEGEDEPLVLFLDGDINVQELAKMSRTMDVKGFEHLSELEESGKKQ